MAVDARTRTAKISPHVAALLDVYKATARISPAVNRAAYVGTMMTLGMRVQWLSAAEQDQYYEEIAPYRDALWRAEQVIEWPE